MIFFLGFCLGGLMFSCLGGAYFMFKNTFFAPKTPYQIWLSNAKKESVIDPK